MGAGASGCSTHTPASDIRGAITAIGSPLQSGPIAAWSNAWRKSNNATSLNYSPDGSAVGMSALASGQAYFAALDSPLSSTDQDLTKVQCGPEGAFSVPVSITSVGVAFNMPNISGLKLSPSVLARIFSGAVTNWSDEEIEDLNPDTRLPDAEIVPVTAPDASPLTVAATEYLSKSPDWSTGVTDSWAPVDGGSEVKRYRDVAKEVNETAGAIAFLDLDSISGRFDTALLSFGGDFVRQSKDSMAIAVKEGRTREGSTGIEFDLPEDSNRGYPLGIVNYQAFCTEYPNEQIASLLTSWGKYILSPDGQATSTYFSNSASPSETALRKSEVLLEKIRAKN
ncbi:hypothetical protein FJ661_17110 [Pseudarthrobacter phenanthrenivorans]|uniref:substrate-binding domain-containing protein n=1 Tax=Pseudarthrobacter phenanthrenivorans TaxID=361575 RepID=UPI00112C0DA5|nr:substrate-binding domain-containing protein [Pseudarthrobacter phenanthrenivorans]TPV49173.1 hypothetical protein FJ661_17110 [Pseudarthrobacter phenanthrenivorans]